MSYQVFARKWRPHTFEDVVNQEHVKTTLSNAIKLDRIAHSYIFAGPRGVGKTSIARILARSLNCIEGPTATPCNECTSCVEIMEDRSMDVMEIDGASNRGIEDIRNIRENVKYSPVHGKKRIYIIDEVHMLTREAFNALLKTLEEPPPHVLFIFATTEFQKIPPTILSRCQKFEFKRLSIPELTFQLNKISENEDLTISEDSLLLISKRAEGSMRDAESLLDQLVSYCGTAIESENVIEILGMIRDDVFFTCSDAMSSGDISEGFRISKQVYDSGYDPGELLNGLLEHFRNILLTKLSGDAKVIETSEFYQQKYSEAAEKFSDLDILRIINTISESEFHIKKSTQPLLRLELLLAKLIAMDSSVTVDKIIEALRGGNASQQSPPQEEQPQKKTEISEPEVEVKVPGKEGEVEEKIESPMLDVPAITMDEDDLIDPGEPDIGPEPPDITENPEETGDESGITLLIIKEKWNEFLDELQHESAMTGAFLTEALPTALEDDVVEISFSSENGFHRDNIERNKQKVKNALKKVFGKNLKFKCILAKFTDEQKQSLSNNKEKEQKTIEKIIEREPIVKTIIDTFSCDTLQIRDESDK